MTKPNTHNRKNIFSKQPLILKSLRSNQKVFRPNLQETFLQPALIDQIKETKREINILIAEDDEDDYFLISSALNKSFESYKIHWVKNGQETLNFIIRCIKEDFLPDLILLDINMPKINGIDLVKIIRERYGIQQVPIIMLSGSTSHSDINKAYEYGANSYLSKREEYSELVKVMKNLYEFWFNCVERPRNKLI